MNQDDIQKQLLATFKIEAEDRLRNISMALLELENNPGEPERAKMAEIVHRETHSLKGAARAVNLLDIEQLCQPMEKIFSAWKRHELNPLPEQFDILHQSLQLLKQTIEMDDLASVHKQANEYISKLNKIIDSQSSEEQIPFKNESIAPLLSQNHITLSDTVRISTTKLDKMLLKVEEMLTVKLVMQNYLSELKETYESVRVWKKESKMTDIKAMGSVSSSAHADEWTENNFNKIKFLEDALNSQVSHFEKYSYHLNNLVDGMLEDTKKLIMLPFKTLLDSFPPMVRNISREQGKEINFILEGTEINIDKRILEELKDPLIHLLRNCIDHGIEKPEERVNLQKPVLGTIKLIISQPSRSEITITISDDGRGINFEAVKNAAIKQGHLSTSSTNEVDEKTLLQFIYLSGISTSRMMTEISGQGLGMAIVKEKIEKMDGEIDFTTEKNKGTKITLTVPLTITTFKGIIVEVSNQTFVVPTAHLERVLRVRPEAIKTIEGNDTIILEDVSLPLTRLHDILELPFQDNKLTDKDYQIPIIIININNNRFAFQVDAIKVEQEILVKKLSYPLVRIKNVAAATILANNIPAPILSTSDLIKSAMKKTLPHHETQILKTDVPYNKSILVAEDSITTRMLMKNILEVAGYDVKTAVDGKDAWQILKGNDIALVVSDVDMPRMDGFQLINKIRSDAKLSELPVILVTGRESQEDLEHGMDVGANAYIIKHNFEDSNLIAMVKRLL